MSEELERVEERLQSIEGVQPILEAQRTISLGGWRMALDRVEAARQFDARLAGIIPVLQAAGGAIRPRPGARPGQIVVLAVGSERGLCGRFNQVVAQEAAAHAGRLVDQGALVRPVAWGTRVHTILERRDEARAWKLLPAPGVLPPFSQAADLVAEWLAGQAAGTLDGVDLVINTYRGGARYELAVERLLPVELPASQDPGEQWPPVIVETDPVRLWARVVEQWVASSLYRLLLSSAAAEYSARYQLMEAAAGNAQRMVDDLRQTLRMALQQSITREVQDLSAGAGLLRTRRKTEEE